VFAPIWLELAGVGAGALGRRSRAETASGQPVSDRDALDRSATAVAVAATLRAAAPRQHGRRDAGERATLVVRPEDLRWQVREGREGNLVLFVVDASGSMAARRRMTATKGAVLSLLLDAYQRRDRVGLVSFRGSGAQVPLPPTSSVELAARRLAELPTGGRTPLAAGLARARQLLAAEAVRDPTRRPLLVLITDGRANAVGASPTRSAGPVAAALAEARALAAGGVGGVCDRVGVAGGDGDVDGLVGLVAAPVELRLPLAAVQRVADHLHALGPAAGPRGDHPGLHPLAGSGLT
jgi:magnesium chelatase subunit D